MTVAPVPSREIAPLGERSAPPPDEGPPKRVVSVTKDESVFVGGEPRTDAELTAFGRQLAKDDPDVRVYFQADRSVRWQRIIQLLDVLKHSGVARFAFIQPGAGTEPLPLDLRKVDRSFLPPASPSGEGLLAAQHTILGIAILADGSLDIDGRREPNEQLVPLARRALANDPDVRVVVRADRAATYGRVVEIYASLYEVGARKVAFGVEVGLTR